MKAIITGATGFVGRLLARRLPSASHLSIGSEGWRAAIAAADFDSATVFHLAARVHRRDDPEAMLMHDNVEKTIVLAQAAAARGAQRFVFLSSVKVNGEESPGRPFTAADPEAPADAYARSKCAAEHALRDIGARSRLSIAVVRSPLVIGEGARGNLHALMRLADTAWPLPFAALDNRRTFIHVEDLASLLVAACQAQARWRVFLAGHPDAVSTARLVGVLRETFGRPARMVPVPGGALEALAGAVGAGSRMRRLTRSLVVDAGDAQRELKWIAEVDMNAGIAAMARAFRTARSAP